MIDTSGVALEIIKDSESVIREISQQPRIWREVWELVQQQESALQSFIQGHDVILFTAARYQAVKRSVFVWLRRSVRI